MVMHSFSPPLCFNNFLPSMAEYNFSNSPSDLPDYIQRGLDLHGLEEAARTPPPQNVGSVYFVQLEKEEDDSPCVLAVLFHSGNIAIFTGKGVFDWDRGVPVAAVKLWLEDRRQGGFEMDRLSIRGTPNSHLCILFVTPEEVRDFSIYSGTVYDMIGSREYDEELERNYQNIKNRSRYLS